MLCFLYLNIYQCVISFGFSWQLKKDIFGQMLKVEIEPSTPDFSCNETEREI